MKIKILIIVLAITHYSFSQTIYEVTPGTKGNEITLTVANISETDAANNVEVILTKKSSALSFNKETETIAIIEAKTEAKASFTFDVNRDAPINKKDTIEFMITDAIGLIITKQFIFSYVGPKEFKLEQNFPNPFNPTTTIQYQIPASPNPSKGGAFVSLKVYDILGSEVVTLVNAEQQPGYYEVEFNASHLASGMYVYRLKAGEYISTKKMLMIK
ncbi:MAG: T9SS type A sorting domain-containing protein [Ignavibacteriota bacterium]|nr:MAG: T9SS C-terminal target domain-containing protein [Chlorobiota bacterium]MBE7476467.1 T9SS type A sorting domain-containing protein [Ignavibacteriales bacterium]MBL1123602.1 T9SS C-terminal target domain-containing protein [Ignavibacteriota bacterium]MCC7093947.1 T9SS type A sorting domain-containing protein [Ignavibacteriaceae bacterium]MCE7855541.1 T9SS C-terminal target domain-containing protein [Ignavibacteria bacterium CHB3]MEB2297054.1 T9SS type A sorting domain-containing protein